MTTEPIHSVPRGGVSLEGQETRTDRDLEFFLANDPNHQALVELKEAVRWYFEKRRSMDTHMIKGDFRVLVEEENHPQARLLLAVLENE